MKNKIPEHNIADLLKFMRLSPKKKLEHLERLNKFLNIVTPIKSKKIWKKLKSSGW